MVYFWNGTAVTDGVSPVAAWDVSPSNTTNVVIASSGNYVVNITQSLRAPSLTLGRSNESALFWPEVVVSADVVVGFDVGCPVQPSPSVTPSPSPSPSVSAEPRSPANAVCKVQATWVSNTTGSQGSFNNASLWLPGAADATRHAAVVAPGAYVVNITQPATVTTLTLFDSTPDATAWPRVVVGDVLTISSNTQCVITPPATPGQAFPLSVGSTTANFTFSPSPVSATSSLEAVTYYVFLSTAVPAFEDTAFVIIPGPGSNFTALVSSLIATATYTISIAGANSQVR